MIPTTNFTVILSQTCHFSVSNRGKLDSAPFLFLLGLIWFLQLVTLASVLLRKCTKREKKKQLKKKRLVLKGRKASCEDGLCETLCGKERCLI